MSASRRSLIRTLSLAALGVAVPGLALAAGIESLRFLGNVSVQGIIARVITGIIGLTGSLALAVFVYGGVLWMTAAGNMEKVKQGKNAIIWASLGIFMIFLSYAAVSFIFGLLER